MHEFMLKVKPYDSHDRVIYKTQIEKEQVILKKEHVPENWTLESSDFINKCIARKATDRLGNNGLYELKRHPWLANFPWDALEARTLTSPFMPPVGMDNFDKENSLSEWKDINDPLLRNSMELL